MEQMVNVFVMGKKYEVPASLTIMKALEYAGYKLFAAAGCRNGFCGAWQQFTGSRVTETAHLSGMLHTGGRWHVHHTAAVLPADQGDL
ncbi:MAG: hypothetical protein ACLSFT_01520 [Ruminococcus callidus]